MTLSLDFNPRACGRRDPLRCPKWLRRQDFNPRACGRRDPLRCPKWLRRQDFNPRACGRRDDWGLTWFEWLIVFQSTRLREARPFDFLLALCRLLFQSTRLREARRLREIIMPRYTNFNPRACGRRDPMHQTGCGDRRDFNPRACGRRDCPKRAAVVPRRYFNPRACGRRDRFDDGRHCS